MHVRYAMIADFASVDAGNKVTIVGEFNTIYDRMAQVPIPFPAFHFITALDAHVTEGSQHRMQLKLLDDDGTLVRDLFDMPIQFASGGPGRPLKAIVILAVGPGSLVVPRRGDYAFHMLVDGRHIGEIPVYVSAPPAE